MSIDDNSNDFSGCEQNIEDLGYIYGYGIEQI